MELLMNLEFEPLLVVLLPWVIFCVIAITAIKLVKSAKAKKGLAVCFGVLVQMFSPDPYVERTIAMVTVEKKATKKQQYKSGEKSNEETTI
jgi:Na+/H+ antiporter NhaC